jgi:DNA-binding transcriptional regulator YiaG
MSLLERPPVIFDVAMTAEEYREIRDELKLNQAEMARLLGVDHRTVQRWASAETQIPPIAARFLRLLSEAKINGKRAARLIMRRMERLQEAA